MKVLLDEETKRVVYAFIPNERWIMRCEEEHFDLTGLIFAEVTDFTEEEKAEFKRSNPWDWKAIDLEDKPFLQKNEPRKHVAKVDWRKQAKSIHSQFSAVMFKDFKLNTAMIDLEARKRMKNCRYLDYLWYQRLIDTKDETDAEVQAAIGTMRLTLQQHGEQV